MDEMKSVAEITLSECNQEIQAAGGAPKKRIDHARGLVTAIRSGKTTGAKAAAESAKRAVKATRATKSETDEAITTNTEPVKGGEEAPVATITKKAKAAKKATRKAAARNGKGKSIIPDSYRSEYKKVKGIKTESGAVAVNCGDGLAGLMAGLDNGEIAKVGRENKVDVAKYASLNPGQIRMNIGNVLRGMLRRGEKVTVNGKTAKV